MTTILSKRGLHLFTGALALTLILSACGGGDGSECSGCVDDPTFKVSGVASGLLEAMTIELTTAKGSERLTVPGDGSFSFNQVLGNGDSFSVTVAGAVPCRVADGIGVINRRNIEVELQCLLADLAVAGRRASLEVGGTDYTAQLSLLQQDLSVTAVAAVADVAITLDGTPLASGEASAPILVGLGETLFAVAVSHLPSGWMHTYTLRVSRGADIVQAAYGKASNTGSSDTFGFSVSLSGDTLVVGAIREDSVATGVDGDQGDDTAADSGAVYVFRRTGSTWRQEAYLKASNTGSDDYFGVSVSLDGDMLAVGAIHEDSAASGIGGDQGDAGEDNGAVYVFRRTGSTWQQEAYIKAYTADHHTGDLFGASVSLSGDTLAVGAVTEDSSATGVVDGNQGIDPGYAEHSGAVYVFRRIGSTWLQEAYLKASNTDAGDVFGQSVSLSGDTLAVGAGFEDSAATGVDGNQGDNTAADSGAVYVFRRTGSTWLQEAYLKASNTDTGDGFGNAVALSGDALAVGAISEDSAAIGVDGSQSDNSAERSGAVYVFQRTGATWQQEAYIKASNTGASDEFGFAVALSGNTLAVGARFEGNAASEVQMGSDVPAGDTGTVDQSGAVYMFRGAGSVWQQEAYLKSSNISTDRGFERFGTSISLSGDTLAAGRTGDDSTSTGFDGEADFFFDGNSRGSGSVHLFN